MNAKQQRFVEEFELSRLAALRRLAEHLGLIATSVALTPSKAECTRRIDVYGADLPKACIGVIADGSAHPINRAACATLLECFLPNWRKIAPPELIGMVAERNDTEVRQWRKAVLEKDGGACVQCGGKQKLEAHHRVRWKDAPWLRVVVSNGVTLCQECHRAHHAA